MLYIMVLGGGCANCHKLADLAKEAAAEMGLAAQVDLVTDLQEIMRYGVMHTPGLVVNQRLVSTGRVPRLAEVKSLIENALQPSAN